VGFELIDQFNCAVGPNSLRGRADAPPTRRQNSGAGGHELLPFGRQPTCVLYLVDAPSLPRGIAVMRENSHAMDLLRRLGNSDRVRSFGSDFDIGTAPSGFGVVVEGALLGTFGERSHDLLVPTESSLGFGRPEPALACSHVHYFRERPCRQR